MTSKQIFSKYALIGDNLDLKQDVTIEINEDGIITKISYNEPDEILEISDQEPTFLLIPGLINSHVHIGDSFAKERGFNKELIEVVAPPDGIKHKLLRTIPENIKKEGIQKAAQEMVSNGITCFIDFREENVEGIMLLKNALKDEKIKYYIYGRFKGIEDIDEVYNLSDGIGLVSYSHISSEIKDKIRILKDKYEKLIACHVAEVKRKESQINKIVEDNLVDVFIHGTHLNKETRK